MNYNFFRSFIFITFLLTHFLSAQDKNIEIIYEQALENDNGEYRILKDLEYSLIANKSTSRFERIKSLGNEAYASNDRYMFILNAAGVYYSDKKSTFHQTEFDNELHLVKMDKSDKEWEITKESKNIAGYKCYKAIHNLKVFDIRTNKHGYAKTHVWFTPEIPVPFGPTRFNGLPGLILQARPFNGRMYFTAKKISETSKTIDKPVKGVGITEEELNELIKEKFKKSN